MIRELLKILNSQPRDLEITHTHTHLFSLVLAPDFYTLTHIIFSQARLLDLQE